jgi:hypothetical protein
MTAKLRHSELSVMFMCINFSIALAIVVFATSLFVKIKVLLQIATNSYMFAP